MVSWAYERMFALGIGFVWKFRFLADVALPWGAGGGFGWGQWLVSWHLPFGIGVRGGRPPRSDFSVRGAGGRRAGGIFDLIERKRENRFNFVGTAPPGRVVVRCIKCSGDRISKYTTGEGTRRRINPTTGVEEIKTVPARHLYQCLHRKCWFQFSATEGTIFNNSHLPLEKWMLSVAIMCNAKKGVSAKQLQRDLECSYKTAWYLSHRIREAMMLGNRTAEKLSGSVEMDETYVGGKFDRRRKRAKHDNPRCPA